MIFYHYTSRANVPSIMEQGLNRGEAPLSHYRVVNAVNLTTDPIPQGHGLDHGGKVVTEREAMIYASHGWNIPAGTVIADKLEVRLTVKVPTADRTLKRWLPWARRNCEPGYPEILAATAGGMTKAKTWWLYFGVIPSSAIIGAKDLKSWEVEATQSTVDANLAQLHVMYRGRLN